MKTDTTRTRPASAPLGGIGPGGKSPRDYLRGRERKARRPPLDLFAGAPPRARDMAARMAQAFAE